MKSRLVIKRICFLFCREHCEKYFIMHHHNKEHVLLTKASALFHASLSFFNLKKGGGGSMHFIKHRYLLAYLILFLFFQHCNIISREISSVNCSK